MHLRAVAVFYTLKISLKFASLTVPDGSSGGSVASGDEGVEPMTFNTSKQFVFVNRFFWPDHSATAQILADLTEHLSKRGALVTVITSRLTYDGTRKLLPSEMWHRVKIRRVATTAFGRANLLGRAFDYATFYLSALFVMLSEVRRGDVLIAKTDPPLISIPASWVVRWKGAKFVNWCQDLFPETAAALGMPMVKGALGSALRILRNRSLRAADMNAALHEKMAEFMEREGIPRSKITVLPNWCDKDIRPVAHASNALRSSWGLEDKFVVSYSGNLGRAHIPDKVADLIEATRSIDGLVWLFIGGGAGLGPLKQRFAALPNVRFEPYQPRERLSESLSVADAHLISLDPACEGLIVPSKLYGALAVSRPVLFLGDSDGAVARDIARLERGVLLDVDHPETWRRAVEALTKGPHGMAPLAETASGTDPRAGLEMWSDALAALVK